MLYFHRIFVLHYYFVGRRNAVQFPKVRTIRDDVLKATYMESRLPAKATLVANGGGGGADGVGSDSRRIHQQKAVPLLFNDY